MPKPWRACPTDRGWCPSSAITGSGAIRRWTPSPCRSRARPTLPASERAVEVVRGGRCRVMRFDAAVLKPGGTVRAQELAWLASPYAVDNLEGLAATKGPRGETLLWLISDDNFNPLQRNILLLF